MTDGSPAVTVIVPAYDAHATLAACVRSVLAQQLDRPFEVVVYASGVDEPSRLGLPADDRLTLLTAPERVHAAAARNRAAAVARGDVFAFTDADAEADAGWLRELLAACPPGGVVAGAVRNGTPGSGPGTVQHLLEFLDYHPDRPPSTAWHGATCNLAVDREAWSSFGPFPEGFRGGEDTMLTTAARRAGRFGFAPRATVVHRNRTEEDEVLAHLRELGRRAAHVSRRGDYRARVLVRTTWLAPVAVLARGVALTGKLVTWGRSERTAARRNLRLVVRGLAAWGAGLREEGLLIDGRGEQAADVTAT